MKLTLCMGIERGINTDNVKEKQLRNDAREGLEQGLLHVAKIRDR